MTWLDRLASGALGLAALAAIATQPATAQDAAAAAPACRAVAAAPQPGEPSRIARAQAALALDLVARLGDGGAHVSPSGAAATLAALDLGADRAMRRAIAATLKLDRRGLDDLRAAGRRLAAVAAESGGVLAGGEAIFVDAALGLKPEMAERLAAEAGIALQSVDFARGDAVAAVDAWVAARTRGLITSILDPGTRFSLAAVSAFGFKACWLSRFDETKTRDLPFRRLDGSTVERPTMHLYGQPLAFRAAGRFAAVELAYADQRFAMVLVTTTDAPAAPAVFRGAADLLAGGGFRTQPVDLALPRFAATSDRQLLDVLGAMGLAPGLASPTQLSGFADGLALALVRQKAVIEVEETGTVAAAATAAVASKSIAPRGRELAFDRPFIYALRHRATGLVLLAGYVADPAGP